MHDPEMTGDRHSLKIMPNKQIERDGSKQGYHVLVWATGSNGWECR